MPHVAFVLFPRFQMLAWVLATEPLRIANKHVGRRLFTWETLCIGRTALAASNDAVVTPDRTDWDTDRPPDLVLLCAGYETDGPLPSGLRAYLARAERNGAVLGGLDTGTVILARLGYLDGRTAVLHHEAEAEFREKWPQIPPSDSIDHFDGRRLTAAGGMATGDAMLSWIVYVSTPELASATSDAMAHGTIRSQTERQRRPMSGDPVLTEMRRLMEDALADPLPVAAIAARLGLSQKQLRRRCEAGFGKPPAEVYLGLRLQYALDLLRGTEIPVRDVALASGFSSPAGFSRLIRKRFGASPRDLRAGQT